MKNMSKKKKVFIILGCAVVVIAVLVLVVLLINVEKLESVSIGLYENSDNFYILTNHLSKTDDMELGIYIEPRYISDSVVFLDFRVYNWTNQDLYDFKDINLNVKINGNCSVLEDYSYYSYYDENIHDIYRAIGDNLLIFHNDDYFENIEPSELIIQSHVPDLYGTIVLSDVQGDIGLSCDVSYDLIGKKTSYFNNFYIRHEKVDFSFKAPE